MNLTDRQYRLLRTALFVMRSDLAVINIALSLSRDLPDNERYNVEELDSLLEILNKKQEDEDTTNPEHWK